MRVFVVALALSVTLSAAPTFAQAPAPAPPASAAEAQQSAAPTPRFQAGLKYAYVYIDQVAASSNAGKSFSAKVKAFQEQKAKELQDKNKALQASQEKLEKGASVMNDAARNQLQIDIERQQRELQRATEDAQQDLNTLAQQMQAEFSNVVMPAIDKVAKEKQVHFVFNAQESGLVWADPSLDLTAEVIQALDAPSAAPAAPAATGK